MNVRARSQGMFADTSSFYQFWRSLGLFVGAEGRPNQHFQQDGAAPHVSKAALCWIRDHFGDRTVSRGTGHSWAANSPDLSPLDFHLWGYLKDKVCGKIFQSIQDLREAITEGMREVPPEQCQSVIVNFTERVRMCLTTGGLTRKEGHLEHVL